MDIKLVNELYESGTLTAMYKAGFVSEKVFTYREIFVWVNHKTSLGMRKNDAVAHATDIFKKDERTIWRALNSFTNG